MHAPRGCATLRRLPLGTAGKLAGMAMLLVGVAGLLWFVVFPAVDPLLPFNDVQVTAPSGSPTDYGTARSPGRHGQPPGPSTVGSPGPRPAPSLPN